MQCYVAWQKRQLKMKNIFWASDSSSTGIMPKSGLYSVTVVSLTLAHLGFIAVMPKESKDEFFYIAKVSSLRICAQQQ